MKYCDYVNVKQGSDSTHRFSNGNTLPLCQLPFGMTAFAPQTSQITSLSSPLGRRTSSMSVGITAEGVSFITASPFLRSDLHFYYTAFFCDVKARCDNFEYFLNKSGNENARNEWTYGKRKGSKYFVKKIAIFESKTIKNRVFRWEDPVFCARFESSSKT